MVNEPETFTCEFCGYDRVAMAAGRYGCPNCLGEGLENKEQEQEQDRRMDIEEDKRAEAWTKSE
tara:strand:- start:1659 stop:1850 length:192 start_codon:yes stop_codon:yes gene_type:complete